MLSMTAMHSRIRRIPTRARLVPVLAAATLLGAGVAHAEALTYTLEPTHTQVDVRWQHMGFSTPSASFDRVQGTLVWDADDPLKASVTVTIPVAGVHTRVPVLDEHFKAPDYFDMAKYPDIRFASTRVERVGLGNRYSVIGELTIRGVTKEVVLDTVLNGAGMHPMFKAPTVGFNATTTLRRSDFGLTESLELVSDEVVVNITTEAVEAQALEAALKAMAAAEAEAKAETETEAEAEAEAEGEGK